MLALVLVLGVSVRPSSAATVILDQSFTSPSNLSAVINECCVFVAQTFTAGLSGTLAGVRIDVERTHPDITSRLHVAIRSAAGGAPTTTVLGETTLDSPDAPLSFLITFPESIILAAGNQYAIVVSYEGAPPAGAGQAQGSWAGATGDEYAPGALLASFADGISWFSLGDGFDVHFQTYLSAPGLTVDVDIRPGDELNSISLSARGLLPVAVLGNLNFNVRDIDLNTVALGSVRLDTRGPAKAPRLAYSFADVNADGLEDLLAFFDIPTLVTVGALTSSTKELTLTGTLLDGTAFEGTDTVTIVPEP